MIGSVEPPLNASEVQRAAQAQAVNNFVDNLLASDANAKVMVAGDLNEFPSEEPMGVLKGVATITNYDVPGSDPFDATATYVPGGTAILHDLQDTLPANEQYDYVFDGSAQTLDHMLVTGNLAAGRRSSTSCASTRSSPTRPAITIRWSRPSTCPRPTTNYTLQLLHLSDGEAGLLAPQTAPNLAALVDAFDDDFANTLILAGGDDFLAGPFLAGGTDLSVIPALNAVTGSTIGATTNIPIGAVDIAILNSIGVEASTIGNHEFDLGSRVLRDAFSPDRARPAGSARNSRICRPTSISPATPISIRASPIRSTAAPARWCRRRARSRAASLRPRSSPRAARRSASSARPRSSSSRFHRRPARR